jgi:hypothetical protein
LKFTWDDNAGRYRGPNGTFVANTAVRQVVDDVADKASERMAALALRLQQGQISLATFQSDFMREIKLSQSAAAVLAHGGSQQMTFSRWGAVGSRVREQYKYAQGFAEDVASGKQPLNGSLLSRAKQYGQAVRVSYERAFGRDQLMRGYTSERNILGAVDKHCSECVAQSSRSWVGIGELVPIGRRRCRSQCRCTIRYSKRDVQEVAA